MLQLAWKPSRHSMATVVTVATSAFEMNSRCVSSAAAFTRSSTCDWKHAAAVMHLPASPMQSNPLGKLAADSRTVQQI